MSIYKTIATYAMVTIPIWASAIMAGVSLASSERIDGYSVSKTNITRCDGLSCTFWKDTDSDGRFDTKQRITLMPPIRSPPVTIGLSFEVSDKLLIDNLVARLK